MENQNFSRSNKSIERIVYIGSQVLGNVRYLSQESNRGLHGEQPANHYTALMTLHIFIEAENITTVYRIQYQKKCEVISRFRTMFSNIQPFKPKCSPSLLLSLRLGSASYYPDTTWSQKNILGNKKTD